MNEQLRVFLLLSLVALLLLACVLGVAIAQRSEKARSRWIKLPFARSSDAEPFFKEITNDAAPRTRTFEIEDRARRVSDRTNSRIRGDDGFEVLGRRHDIDVPCLLTGRPGGLCNCLRHGGDVR